MLKQGMNNDIINIYVDVEGGCDKDQLIYKELQQQMIAEKGRISLSDR